MDQQTKRYYLNQIGIPVWLEKENNSINSNKTQKLTKQNEKYLKSNDNWNTLQQDVITCQACGLDKSRTQTVFGVGNHQAELLIIGEAPGFYEDQKGEPFVGRAGQLLDNMLKAIDLDRKTVFIANILKCRPPNNRDPKPEEVNLCTPYLLRQIKLIQPKLILAVGRIAAHFLLQTNTPLSKLRNIEHEFNKIPLQVTYHPAYLLRNPRDKAKAWQDLLAAKQKLKKIN